MDDFYYVYEDDQNDLYYYSAMTKESTYIKPRNKIFLDPETNDTYIFKTKTKDIINKAEIDHKKKNEKLILKADSISDEIQENKIEEMPIQNIKSESDILSHNKRNCFFVYKTIDNVLYYYNCSTQETTYEKPKDAKFFDPTTKMPYIFDNSPIKPKKLRQAKLSHMDEKQAQLIHNRPRRNDIIPIHFTANRRSTSPNLLF